MITSIDELANALGNNTSRVVIDKASLSTMVAGAFGSLWRATGIPAQGAIPTSAALCTKATVGAIGFTNQTDPATSYYAWQNLATSNATTNLEIHDRLANFGGLSGTVTTAQNTTGLDLASLSLPSARRGDANYSDVQWWFEWYTATGATGVTATVNVTYDDSSTGNIVVALPASVAASRLYPIVSAVAGRFIKGVNSVTLSATTGTAGNFGVTATRPRTGISTILANKLEIYDWQMLGLPEVPNDACLMLLMLCTTTTTGTVRGQGKIAHG